MNEIQILEFNVLGFDTVNRSDSNSNQKYGM